MSDFDYLAHVKKRHAEPYFTFPEIPPIENLSFVKLTKENFTVLYQLFKDDTSPFVDNRFKTYEGVRDHAAWVTDYGPYTPKHGGCDWLFKVDECGAGILHLFDMSLETFAQNHKRAWIGFATSKAFRRKGLTAKAVRHFIDILFRFYTGIDFIHAVIMKENSSSASFLVSCGFQHDDEESISEDFHYFLLTRSRFYLLREKL